MKINWIPLLLTVIVSTLLIFFGSVAGFFIPNPNLPNDSLLAEVTPPLIAAGFFGLIAGYVASREPKGFRSGALGGTVNALTNLGLLFLVLSIWDSHFIAIGGRSLAVWLPLVALPGALVGTLGAGVKKLLKR
jgi:hypothetical protein